MTYHSYISSNIFYYLVPLIGLAISLNLIFFIIKRLPAGGRKSKLITYIGYCSVSFLLVILLSIHLNPVTGKTLSRIVFSCFASLPLWNYLLLFEERESNRALRFIFLSLIPLLFILPFIFTQNPPLTVLLFFLSGWFLTCASAVNLFRKSLGPRLKNRNFHGMITQILSGLGFFLDFILVSRWLTFPVFSIIFLVLMIIEISGNLLTPEEKEFRIEESALYITPVLIVPLSLIISKGITTIAGLRRSHEFILYYRGYIIMGTVFLCLSLYYPVLTGLRRLLKTIGDHFVDDFTRDLNKLLTESDKLDLKIVSGFLEKYSPDVKFQFAMRAPYWNIFKIIRNMEGDTCNDSKSIYTCPEIIEDFERQGYSLWTPGNIEMYSSCGDFFEETAGKIDMSDVLIIPVSPGGEDNYPLALFIFQRVKERVFKFLDIKKIYLLVKGIKSMSLEIYKSYFSKRIVFPDRLLQLKSYSDIAEEIFRGMEKYLPIEKFFLAILSKDYSPLEIYTEPGKREVEVRRLIESLPGIVEDTEEPLLIQAGEEKDFCFIFIFIRFPGDYNSLIVFVFNRQLYHREQNYRADFQPFASGLKSALTRIKLISELNRQKTDLNNLLLKSEDERRQVAEEIHDTIAQEMYAAKLLIEILEKKITKNSLQSDGDIEILKTTVNEGVKQVRKIINNLREPGEEPVDIILRELTDFIERQSRESGIRIGLENPEILKLLPGEHAKHIALIIREGVNNSIKHSNAKHVRIRLKKTDNFVSLIMADDGRGFNTDEQKNRECFGIEGIKSKCERIGGKLRIRSAQGSGVVLYVRADFDGI